MRNPFKWFWNWCKGGINSGLDKLEDMQDPNKVQDQLINDMRAQHSKYRDNLVEAEVGRKRIENDLKAQAGTSREWEARAGRAAQAGNDAEAVRCLARKRDSDSLLKTIQASLQKQVAYVEKWKRALREAEGFIEDAVVDQRNLATQAKLAETERNLASLRSSVVASVDEDDAFAQYKRFKTKIEEKVLRAEVISDLSVVEGSGSSEELKLLEASDELSDELATLKAKLHLLPEKTE